MTTIRNEGKEQIFWKESFPKARVLPDRVLIWGLWWPCPLLVGSQGLCTCKNRVPNQFLHP